MYVDIVRYCHELTNKMAEIKDPTDTLVMARKVVTDLETWNLMYIRQELNKLEPLYNVLVMCSANDSSKIFMDTKFSFDGQPVSSEFDRYMDDPDVIKVRFNQTKNKSGWEYMGVVTESRKMQDRADGKIPVWYVPTDCNIRFKSGNVPDNLKRAMIEYFKKFRDNVKLKCLIENGLYPNMDKKIGGGFIWCSVY